MALAALIATTLVIAVMAVSGRQPEPIRVKVRDPRR